MSKNMTAVRAAVSRERSLEAAERMNITFPERCTRSVAETDLRAKQTTILKSGSITTASVTMW